MTDSGIRASHSQGIISSPRKCAKQTLLSSGHYEETKVHKGYLCAQGHSTGKHRSCIQTTSDAKPTPPSLFPIFFSF